MNPSLLVQTDLDNIIDTHPHVRRNNRRTDIIEAAVRSKEALISCSGALATWTPSHSTGRIPKDTYMVKDDITTQTIDWESSACNSMLPDTFDFLWKDAIEELQNSSELYVSDKTIGAEVSHALPVQVLSNSALKTLFVDTMFRPVPENIKESIFADTPFTLLVLPESKIDTSKYENVLRNEKGKTVDMIVAMDFERRRGIVYGCTYCGSVKKLMFTAMNYLLPSHGILPLHCSANEGSNGDTALFLGLSGTGKTTISNDPNRMLLGDDEHSWSDTGVSNMEYGCYAKMIHLDAEKEPNIYNAVFKKRPYREDGCIVENAMMYPNGEFDLDDNRFAENSRASYPGYFLQNQKPEAKGGHPNTMIFLTADANGVLPPISRLTVEQAQLWFLLGYTTKLAGVEVGITSPVVTFSRFFGEPFMPRHPQDYLNLLRQKIEQYHCNTYLVNTGWTGGAYGTGVRIDIPYTRAMVTAALQGDLENVECKKDAYFHLHVPLQCPGVPKDMLNPSSTWSNAQEYNEAAAALAAKFADYFDALYTDAGLDSGVVEACPGK